MGRALVVGLAVVLLIMATLAGYRILRNDRSTTAPPQQAATAPPAPAPAAPVPPSFDVVRVGPGGETVIAGRAEPGAKVTLYDGDKVLGTVTADPRGEWVFVPSEPLPPGSHALGLSAKSANEGPESKSEGVVVVAVPEPSKEAAGQAEKGSASSLAVLLPRDGAGPARALQMPDGAGAEATHRILFLDIVQYDGTGNLSVVGRAPTEGRVLLYLQNRPVGDARADSRGSWIVKPKEPVPVGRYTLRADLVDADAKVIARVALRFHRIDVMPDLVGNQFLVVQPGNTLWRIAQRSYGNGVLFSDIFAANRSDIEDPNLIYPDQVVTLPPH